MPRRRRIISAAIGLLSVAAVAGGAQAHADTPSAVGAVASATAEVRGEHGATGGRSIDAATTTITEGTKVSLSGAARNSVYACQAGNANAPGSTSTPWLTNGKFMFSSKPTVQGKVYWSNARVRVYTTSGGRRVVTANGQPRKTPTGVFPIATNSTAYTYDQNPGSVGSRTVVVSMPKTPTRLSTPRCLPAGVIGYLSNGAALFNALDARGEDAVAHEVLDLCQGHPAGTLYHYHWPSLCVSKAGSTTAPSGIIGWALDGYPITGPRGTGGKLYKNSDLDACHGTTSTLTIKGKATRTYHYVGNYEYPYTLGCFRAAPVTDSSQAGALPGGGGGQGGPPPR